MRLIESVLFKDSVYYSLNLHQKRMDGAFRRFAPNIKPHDLSRILPSLEMKGTYKVRIVYDMDTEDVEFNIEFSEYTPKKIRSLEVITSKPFDYSIKFEDRTEINSLMAKSSADDIIISIDDNITDGSYFNLVFWDGKNWFTPDTPLLNGVRRQQLLAEGTISEKRIQISDLEMFEKVSLVNAMLDLGEIEVPVSAIN